MTTPLFPDGSPLRNPPPSFSKKQILFLDGLRYSAEMANIAYERLRETLRRIETVDPSSVAWESASALQDAWSIIDSVNRFRDLLPHMPGIQKGPWLRLLKDRTSEVAALRDCVQHQQREIDKLIRAGGQIWGYLSWASERKWHMLSGGTTFCGDQWLFMGPITLPFHVPNNRIRLNAFDKQVYLWRIVAAVATAARRLESEIQKDEVLPAGPVAGNRRGADEVWSGTIEVVISNHD